MEAKKSFKRILSLCLAVVMAFSICMIRPITSKAGGDVLPGVIYKTHVQTFGWEKQWKNWGETSGTSGKAKRLEAIQIKIVGMDNLGVEYRTHIQSYGWEKQWKKNGQTSGTSGEAKRLEAIQIRLTGANAGKYDICYRVHAQTYGWLGWVKNGEPAGTAGQAKRLEAIQIIVIPKGDSPTWYADGSDNTVGCGFVETAKSATSDANGAVSYMTHVQTYGNQKWVSDGSIAGTSGEAKRLEAISIKVNNAKLDNISGGIKYQTHVQSYGWQGWKKDGQASGTSGEAKRLEAIRIELTGNLNSFYDIYYRVHAQTYGWMGWAKNGNTAGTAGLAKRLEAIQIVIVPKGEKAPNILPAAKGTAAYRGTPEKADSSEIYIYSWNSEVQDRLEYFKEKYPQYADSIKYVNLGMGGTSDEYKQEIEKAILNGGAKVPSIVAFDSDIAKYGLASDQFVEVSSIGITSDMYKNAFPYTKEVGSIDGKLKGLTWQATPGCFIYRTDIAQKVLGTSDPAKVQQYVKDWDTFMATAAKMKKAGYKMVSSPADIKKAVLDQRTNAWVNNDTVTVDPTVTQYLQLAKKLVDNGYTSNSSQWDDTWHSDFTKNVFGYFGCTWFTYWCINDVRGSKTYGKRNICEGPAAYYWGGTYLGVTKQCPNKQLAKLVLYTLCCDTDTMYKMGNETLDFVNNKASVQKQIANGIGRTPELGGANPLQTWYNVAMKIQAKHETEYDSVFRGYVDFASMAYNEGSITTLNGAVSSVKSMIKDGYPYLTVK